MGWARPSQYVLKFRCTRQLLSFPCPTAVKLGHSTEISWIHSISFTSDDFARSWASRGKIKSPTQKCCAETPGQALRHSSGTYSCGRLEMCFRWTTPTFRRWSSSLSWPLVCVTLVAHLRGSKTAWRQPSPQTAARGKQPLTRCSRQAAVRPGPEATGPQGKETWPLLLSHALIVVASVRWTLCCVFTFEVTDIQEWIVGALGRPTIGHNRPWGEAQITSLYRSVHLLTRLLEAQVPQGLSSLRVVAKLPRHYQRMVTAGLGRRTNCLLYTSLQKSRSTWG